MMPSGNRINKKILWKGKPSLLLFFLALGLVLAACRGDPTPALSTGAGPTEPITSPTQTPEPPPAAVEVETPTVEDDPATGLADPYAQVEPSGEEVTFWHTFTGSQESTLLDVITTFNGSNPWGITVSAVYQGSGEDLGKKMLTFMNTEEQPSLVVADGSQAATYQLGEALVGLDPLVAHPTWGLAPGEVQDFYPGLFEDGLVPAFGGTRLSYPLFGEIHVVYYNADWLSELGYAALTETPGTFTEAACSAAGQPFSGSTAGGSQGLQFTITPASFTDWAAAFGGKQFDPNSSRYNFEKSTLIEAMSFLQTLSGRGCGSPVPNPEEARVNFSRGVTLFVVDSTDAIADLRTQIQNEANFNWRIAPLPHNTSNLAENVIGTGAAIPKTTPETQLAAWLFLRHFTSPEVQAQWVRGTGSLPVRESAAEFLGDYFSTSPAYQMTLEFLARSTHGPVVPRYSDVQNMSQAALADILAGADPFERLAQLSETANSILDEQMALIPESQDPWAEVDPSGQTITFWHPHTESRQTALEEIVNEFNATNKWGITVIPESQGSYGNIFLNLLPALGTEDVPDLVTAYQEHAAAYHLAEGLADMTNLVESSVWGLTSQAKDDFYPGIYAQDIYPVFDGVRLGFPIQRSIDMLYYNIDWLDELGFDDPPATLGEFSQMACVGKTPFSRSPVESGLGYSFYIDATRFSSWIKANGGETFDADTNQFNFNNDPANRVMDTVLSLIEAECAAHSTERSEVQLAFGEGNLLFMVDSSYQIPVVGAIVDENASFDWGVAPLPSSDGNSAGNLFGASASISASTPEAQLAVWLFLKYFTTPEIQAQWAQATHYLPVRISATEYFGDDLANNPKIQSALGYLPYGVSDPALPGYDFIRQEIELALGAILNGADTTGTLDSLSATTNQVLRRHLER